MISSHGDRLFFSKAIIIFFTILAFIIETSFFIVMIHTIEKAWVLSPYSIDMSFLVILISIYIIVISVTLLIALTAFFDVEGVE